MSISDAIKEQILNSLNRRQEIQHSIQQNELGTFEERMKLFAQLENWRRELEEALSFCTSERDELSALLLEEMAENNIQRMTVEGLTIYRRSDFYCNKKAARDGVTQEVICSVLQNLGLGHLVEPTFKPSALKAKVKEWLVEGVEIPAELAELINYGVETRLVSTR